MDVGNMGEAKHGAGHIGESVQGQAADAIEGRYRSLPATGTLKRLLSLWSFVSRAHTLGVRGAAFDAAGKVFLVRHTYVPGWYMPGGGVEIGETCHAALKRELAEEGNLRFGDPPALFGLYHNTGTTRRDHIALYICRDIHQVRPHQGDREIAEAGFFSLDALPDTTTPATRRRLAEITGARPQSLQW